VEVAMSKKIEEFKYSFIVDIITLKEFIERVEIKEFDDLFYAYNAQVSTPDFSAFLEDVNDYPEEETHYKKKVTSMVKANEEKLFLNYVLNNGEHSFKWKVPIQDFYEDLGIDHMMNFGMAKCIVKLGARRYMVADPCDFARLHGKRGKGVVAYHHNRLLIREMMPITEKEAIRRAKKIIGRKPTKEMIKNLEAAGEVIEKANELVKKIKISKNDDTK